MFRKLQNGDAPVASVLLLALATMVTVPAHAQTFTVLHNFTGSPDGAMPGVGLTMDQAGNLYGTTTYGGNLSGCDALGCGVVFKLARHNSSWIFSPLYSFSGGSDGAYPAARVAFGPNGTLYGSTALGGNGYFADGVGVIFNLQPPAHTSGNIFQPWTENVLYTFSGVFDGNYPTGDLNIDSNGKIYGTTQSGGDECEDTVYCGTVFELAPNQGNWTESILYEFMNGNVAVPNAGVIFDNVGNLFGTTSNYPGAVFELVRSGSSWTEQTLYIFGAPPDGNTPFGGLVFDGVSNFYGTTNGGGANGVGTVYELMPMYQGWTDSILYSFTNGGGSGATLFRDRAGSLYGTTCEGGAHRSGSVFRLSHLNGAWTETDLYDFTGGTDGYCPAGSVIVDSGGKVYGTTTGGGASQNGVVFEIAPS